MIGLLCFCSGRLGLAVQVKGSACSRECGAATSVDCFAAQAAWPRPAHEQRSLFFVQLYRWFPSILTVLTIIRPECVGILRAFAAPSGEVTIIGRTAADRDGPARADLANERREPALGSAAQSSGGGRLAGMAYLSSQSYPRYRRHGFVRCPNHRLQTAIWLRHYTA